MNDPRVQERLARKAVLTDVERAGGARAGELMLLRAIRYGYDGSTAFAVRATVLVEGQLTDRLAIVDVDAAGEHFEAMRFDGLRAHSLLEAVRELVEFGRERDDSVICIGRARAADHALAAAREGAEP